MPAPFPARWNELKSLLIADQPPAHPGLYVPPRRSCAADVASELLGSSGERPKFLLVGPRGGGKSTELRRIWRQVHQHLLVAAVDLDRSGVHSGSVGAADLCYLGGLAFLRHLPESSSRTDLFQRLQKIYAEDDDAEAGALGSLSEALGGLADFATSASALSLALGASAGAAPVVAGGFGLAGLGIRLFTKRKGAVVEDSPLGSRLQAVIGEIAHAVRAAHDDKVLCLFVDGLEKMNGEAGERFKELFQRTLLLARAPWSAVFAAPPCTLTETFGVEGQGWSARVVWGFGPDDLDALARLLELRFREAGIEPPAHLPEGALQRWAERSGGMPRHAVEMAHRAAELARRTGGGVLGKELVEQAIVWKAEALGMGLDQGHFDVMKAVLRPALLPRDDRAASLFADGRVLALPPDGSRRTPHFVVHPLLHDDVAGFAVAGG